MELQFPAMRIALSEAWPPLASGPARLILIHDSGEDTAHGSIELCRSEFPDTPIAVIVNDLARARQMALNYLEGGRVQGVVPLTLKLDVWLAAISLLLTGGEYCPVLRAVGDPVPARRIVPELAPPERREERRPPLEKGNGSLHANALLTKLKLTQREEEILKLLSQGCQNKLIAHRMNLSEHTIKVHVHNLFAKLRVNNRTQAAVIRSQLFPEESEQF